MMKVVFLGGLRDVAGAAERAIEPPTSVLEYLAHLAVIEPDLYGALTQAGIRQALNLTLLPLGQDAPLKVGDELAFMPPFSGG